MRRGSRLLALLLLLAPAAGIADEVPDPLFWGSAADFLRQVEDGRFDPHLELHLLQYSVDPRWAADWAAARWSGSGLLGQFGSTTARNLFVDSEVALNLFPAERVQVRYARRDYQDGRFDVPDQAFGILVYPGAGWGVMVTGWPTHEKETASIGLGLRLGGPRSADTLVVSVVDDRFVWNEKTATDVRFIRHPVRVTLQGHLQRGPLRLHGSVDHGLRYEAEEPGVADGSPVRKTSGAQSLADVGLLYEPGGWGGGLRVTVASLERRQSGVDGPSLALDRDYARVVVSVRRDRGAWSVAGLAGYAAQRDGTSSPAAPDGSYAMDAGLLGVEGARRLGKGFELRAGYLGSWSRFREEAASSALVRDETVYSDKVHLRALWEPRPRMGIEVLLSHSLAGSSFGGGSMKARLVF